MRNTQKSLGSPADSQLLPCRSCSSLNARFWQELRFLTQRCTPQGRSWEWTQNKTVLVKYLFHLGWGQTVRRSPDWCYSVIWETCETSVKECCSELHCHTIFCMWTQKSSAQSRQTKVRSCKSYLYKKVLHDLVIGSNCYTTLHVYLQHLAGAEDDEQHTWGASAGIKNHIIKYFLFLFLLCNAFITRGNGRNCHRNINSVEIRSIIMLTDKMKCEK